MLPLRLLDVEVREGRVVPRWLGPRDERWIGAVLGAFETLVGQRASAEEEVWRQVLFGIAKKWEVPSRTIALTFALERKRWTTRVAAPVDPEKARDVTFELAARQPRRVALFEAARALGVTAEDVERSLFADRPEARILVPPEERATPRDAVDRQNLALVVGLLERATEMTARVCVDPQPLAWRAKREGLVATFAEEAGATRVQLSGPLALFHDTTKYGAAMTRFVPHLVAEAGWSLSAKIVMPEGPALLELDDRAPLTSRAPAPMRPRGPAARLVRDLEKRAGTWRAAQTTDAVRTPSGVFFPDLAVERDGKRVLVEILTYGTPEHVASVRAALDQAGADTILCVDRNGVRGKIAPHPRVVPFDGVIDVGELLASAERASDPPRPTEAYA
jgi:predicted nuclease of restriction endonuclease-like RecB superfamily